ncbi:hypothetical protein CANCADRAFT_58652 [Tortispora caseinolytica NRRL Y-17796]|uniref:ABC transporter domain-containing protein n=1 Tax=Tortispora caseinolytica NRRL Y-17796 TaxID=767744 RepID=A0A1E4TDI6_9ASCO|nr:hypothetical protein CANCADRAFT_58652 [Tortispora caseinolytica NRRL Y-17796]
MEPHTQKMLAQLRQIIVLTKNNPKRLAAVVGLLTSAVVFYLRRTTEEPPKLHRQSSSMLLAGGAREIFVPNEGKSVRMIIKPTEKAVFDAHRGLFIDKYGRPAVPSSGQSIALNKDSLRRFSAIWAIMLRKVNSKTSAIMLLHLVFLVGRTWLSLLVARLDGRIVRDIVAADGRSFVKAVVMWLALGVPASYCNSMIKFLEAKLAIAFRTNLTRYIHDLYVNSHAPYYKLPNLDGTLTDADQYITADVTKFCNAAASLYSTIGKPLMDLIIFNYQLANSLGPVALGVLLSNYCATAVFLRRMSPPFGKLKAQEAKLEGEFRAAHTRVITNAEEIAFYEGASLERAVASSIFRKLTQHLKLIAKTKIAYNMLEDFVLKYTWSAWGYIIVSLPIFLPEWGGQLGSYELNSSVDKLTRERDRMKGFITNKRLMLSLADAGGRMMYAIKDLSEFAGYTARVYEFLAVLHRVNSNSYQPLPKLLENHERGKRKYSTKMNLAEAHPFSLEDVQGTIQEGFEGVRLEGVPIVAPGSRHDMSGEKLVNDLSFIIRGGDHVLIIGPNGSGKSSTVRVIGGLWPVFRGLVSRPKGDNLYILPQRPYFSSGTLRDQVIYPDSHADMVLNGRTDQELINILKAVRLAYIPSREGGWETRKEWKDVFSGGEKQRMGFARLLYHSPKVGIIDEGTSAVSSDVEGILYESAKAAGITLMTISNRPSLMRYHKLLIRLGCGETGHEWTMEPLTESAERTSVETEMAALKEELANAENLRQRYNEVTELLGGKVN